MVKEILKKEKIIIKKEYFKQKKSKIFDFFFFFWVKVFNVRYIVKLCIKINRVTFWIPKN